MRLRRFRGLRHHRLYYKHPCAGRKVQPKSRRLSGILKLVIVLRTRHASCTSVDSRVWGGRRLPLTSESFR